MSYTPRPDTLFEREQALEVLVRGIADEYRDLSDHNAEYGANLERKVFMLEALANELGGVTQYQRLPLPDEEIPF